jgi:hypothetical protein
MNGDQPRQEQQSKYSSDQAKCDVARAISLARLAVFPSSVQLADSTPVTAGAANNKTLWDTPADPLPSRRTVPRNSFGDRTVISILQRGVVTAVANQQLEITAKIGTVSLAPVITFPADVSNAYWDLDVMVTVRGAGTGSRAIDVRGRFSYIEGTTMRALAIAGTGSFNAATPKPSTPSRDGPPGLSAPRTRSVLCSG